MLRGLNTLCVFDLPVPPSAPRACARDVVRVSLLPPLLLFLAAHPAASLKCVCVCLYVSAAWFTCCLLPLRRLLRVDPSPPPSLAPTSSTDGETCLDSLPGTPLPSKKTNNAPKE